MPKWTGTRYYEYRAISYRANQIWYLLRREIKKSTKLVSSKLKIEQWHCLECPCTLCKTHLPNRGCL